MTDSKKYQHEYWLKNKEKRRKYNTEYVRAKRGGYKPKSEYSGMSPRDKQRLIRMKVLKHYSGGDPKCKCCGELEIKFLSMDHINNDGNVHRKSISKSGRGGNMTYWILLHGFPEGFQVLCYNCNLAKGLYGVCPHKVKVV